MWINKKLGEWSIHLHAIKARESAHTQQPSFNVSSCLWASVYILNALLARARWMCFALHLWGCCGCQADRRTLLLGCAAAFCFTSHKAISLFARYYTRINCLRCECVCALGFAGIIIIKRLENWKCLSCGDAKTFSYRIRQCYCALLNFNACGFESFALAKGNGVFP